MGGVPEAHPGQLPRRCLLTAPLPCPGWHGNSLLWVLRRPGLSHGPSREQGRASLQNSGPGPGGRLLKRQAGPGREGAGATSQKQGHRAPRVQTRRPRNQQPFQYQFTPGHPPQSSQQAQAPSPTPSRVCLSSSWWVLRPQTHLRPSAPSPVRRLREPPASGPCVCVAGLECPCRLPISPAISWSWLMGPRTPSSQTCPATRPIRSHSAVPRSSWAPQGGGGGGGHETPAQPCSPLVSVHPAQGEAGVYRWGVEGG